MCNKVDARIECLKCGYPYTEACYPDMYPDTLDCDTPKDVLAVYAAREATEFDNRLKSIKT